MVPAFGAALFVCTLSAIACLARACPARSAAFQALDALLSLQTIIYVLCTAFIVFPVAVFLAKRIPNPAAAAIAAASFTVLGALALHLSGDHSMFIKTFAALLIQMMLPWTLGAWCATLLWPYEHADAAIDQ